MLSVAYHIINISFSKFASSTRVRQIHSRGTNPVVAHASGML